MADTEHRLLRREDIEATRRPFDQASPLAGPPHHDAAIMEAERNRIGASREDAASAAQLADATASGDGGA